jgi:hypothetical protein
MAIPPHFNYYQGIQEDFSNMIDEIGTECLVEVPVHTVDTWGNHTTTTYSSSTETIWVRAVNEVMDVANIGQLNKDDIRFVAKHNTTIVIESRITYNGVRYYVLGIDNPDESGFSSTRVGYGRKELT